MYRVKRQGEKMGVMECRRKGCKNILCNRYSTTYGYICDECFEEMKMIHIPIPTFLSIRKSDLPNYGYDEEYKSQGNSTG